MYTGTHRGTKFLHRILLREIHYFFQYWDTSFWSDDVNISVIINRGHFCTRQQQHWKSHGNKVELNWRNHCTMKLQMIDVRNSPRWLTLSSSQASTVTDVVPSPTSSSWTLLMSVLSRKAIICVSLCKPVFQQSLHQ